MNTRRLAINDYDAMIQLWFRAGLPVRPNGRESREAIAAEMASNPDFFIGVSEESRLIGAVVLSADKRKGWINRLAVDPDYRRRSIARMLIAECEKIFGERGLKIFCALVESSNVASKELFRDCGYVEHGDIVYFSKRESNEI